MDHSNNRSVGSFGSHGVDSVFAVDVLVPGEGAQRASAAVFPVGAVAAHFYLARAFNCAEGTDFSWIVHFC